MSKLYVVGTPIGNLEDVSLRAIRILNEVDVILSEDTRVTKKLLEKYEINTKLESYHAHSDQKKESAILEKLQEGRNLALVSDAGMPTISDPGSSLIAHIREELPETKIESVPGPTALTAAYSVSGVSSNAFTFLGFIPHKKGRQKFFKEIKESKVPVIFYESTHRIEKSLKEMSEVLMNRKIHVFRELTKMFESEYIGTPEEVLEKMSSDKNHFKGEFVVIVE